MKPSTNNPYGKLGDGKFSSEKPLIASWNINGIRAVMKKGDLLNYLKTVNPDVLCLNETKIDDAALEKEKIANEFPSEYQQFWNCCKG